MRQLLSMRSRAARNTLIKRPPRRLTGIAISDFSRRAVAVRLDDAPMMTLDMSMSMPIESMKF